MKLILEMLPLIVFFIVYKVAGIISATAAIILVSIISVVLHYIIFKNVSKGKIISACLVSIMGGATILSGDSDFIKMKPTAFFLVISAVLFYNVCSKKYYIKLLFGHAFHLPDKAWHILSRRMVVFFICMALINEYIWRQFSESTWVSFKVFGFFPILLIFMLCQLPLFNKYTEKNIKRQ
jgi:intracellular septation protein